MPESQEGWLTAAATHKMNSSATEGNQANLTQLALDKPRLACFVSFYFLNACNLFDYFFQELKCTWLAYNSSPFPLIEDSMTLSPKLSPQSRLLQGSPLMAEN